VKNDQIKQFKLRCDFLKISTDLQTEFAASAYLAEGQWLEKQLNVEKFRMF
jgi:hypothetical protein